MNPSRHPVAALWSLALALSFVLYETTLPFDFRCDGEQLRTGLARAALDPWGTRSALLLSSADLLGNVALFVPVGLFLSLSGVLARTGRARGWLLVLLGLLLSAAIEGLQLFSPRRYTQTTDLMMNGAGTLLGVLLAGAGGRVLFERAVDDLLRRLRDDPGWLLLAGLTVAIVVGSLLPLDINITPRSLRRQLGEIDLDPLVPGGRLASLMGLLKIAGIFAFWGAAAAHRLADRTRRPLLGTLAGALGLAMVAEFLQLFVASRTLDPFDPLAGLLGAAAGAVFLLAGRSAGLSSRTLGAVAVAAYAVYLALDALSPLDAPALRALVRGDLPPLGDLSFSLVPLGEAGDAPRVVVLGDWLARAARCAPLGALLALAVHNRARRWLWAALALLALLGLEWGESALGLGRGDMTDVVMAGAGLAAGWLLAGRLKRRLETARLYAPDGRGARAGAPDGGDAA